MVGQGVQGLSQSELRSDDLTPAAAAPRAGVAGRFRRRASAPALEERGGSGIAAATLIGPATFVIAAGLLVPLAILK